MCLLAIIIMYTFLKAKYLYNREQWSLIQQTVVADIEELQKENNFVEDRFQNISLAFQVYKKKPKQTLDARDSALSTRDTGGAQGGGAGVQQAVGKTQRRDRRRIL